MFSEYKNPENRSEEPPEAQERPSDEATEEPEVEGPERVEPATLPTDLLGGKFLDPSGR
jgi:hypothetical protein